MSIDLTTLAPGVRDYVASLVADKLRLEMEVKLRDEKIRLLNLRIWGPKSEKLSPNQIQMLFGEISVTAGEVEQEAARPEAEKQAPLLKVRPSRAGKHPGRAPLPAHLERREVVIPCHPDDCRCSQCGAERPVIGYETSETLTCQPAEFWVQVTKREKRGSHCLPEQGVATAPLAERILPKSKLSDRLIIEALTQKFQLHLPIYRQCAYLEENYGIELSRQTLDHAVLTAGELLRAVVKVQALELTRGQYIQADETTLPCQTPEKTGRNHPASMWQFSLPRGAVVFDFQMGRGRAGPAAFLKGFKGVLQCDGYAAYAELGEGIVYAGCMAHARRKFMDAAKLAPLDPLPVEVVLRIAKLYEVEEEARTAEMTPAQRQALRQQKSVPLMAALQTRLMEIRQQILPGGSVAKACDYALGQWTRLEVFLSNGLVEIDNNWCEGGMRPLVLGRNNWLHIGSEEAGPKVAAIASIVETCRRLDINLRDYLTEVLPKLGAWPVQRVGELTPAAWKAANKP